MAEQNEKDSVQTTSGSGEHREKDLCADQRDNGHDAVQQRDIQILHGHRSHC